MRYFAAAVILTVVLADTLAATAGGWYIMRRQQRFAGPYRSSSDCNTDAESMNKRDFAISPYCRYFSD